ncbi:MAG TPA: hypothetical protein VK184_10005, partial [Nostocaceae cyanobacterium]|nr:hypothetical protein [Nostocaceae cyanobacterium]
NGFGYHSQISIVIQILFFTIFVLFYSQSTFFISVITDCDSLGAECGLQQSLREKNPILYQKLKSATI